MNPLGLRIEGLRVTLDGRPVLQDIELEADAGELLVLAGPSGSGKSTLLRAIAGLQEAEGQIYLGADRISGLPPGRREVAMVFQNHALMPHLSVRENLEFGLRARRTPRIEAFRRAGEMAESLGIAELLDRQPDELSGGEQQRVALGRALLREARLILMDEPLSSLDGPLRARLRNEILTIHERIGATIVYVTHDQTEALGMADRLGVLDDGRLLQLAPPREIYADPARLAVATFFGQPEINLLAVTAAGGRVTTTGLDLPLAATLPDGPVLLGIRPEQVAVQGSRWAREHGAHPALDVRVKRTELLGDVQVLHLDLAGQPLRARVEADLAIAPGDAVSVQLDPAALMLFDIASGERLR